MYSGTPGEDQGRVRWGCSTAAAVVGGSRVEFTLIAIRSTRARAVEGVHRATDDGVLIIDSTPSW